MLVGLNLLWYVKNFENGINLFYFEIYGLMLEIDEDDVLMGIYICYYDDVVVVLWFWNVEKKVFLLIEDE